MTGQLSRDGLKALLQQNVIELWFIRRNDKAGFPQTRRMLCTLDKNLLLSLPGRLVLNYQMATHPPAYNPVQHNVVFVWDIFWQDWRAIPVEWVRVIAAHPTHTQKDQEKFWKFFEGYLAKMSAQDKIRFMKS